MTGTDGMAPLGRELTAGASQCKRHHAITQESDVNTVTEPGAPVSAYECHFL